MKLKCTPILIYLRWTVVFETVQSSPIFCYPLLCWNKETTLANVTLYYIIREVVLISLPPNPVPVSACQCLKGPKEYTNNTTL